MCLPGNRGSLGSEFPRKKRPHVSTIVSMAFRSKKTKTRRSRVPCCRSFEATSTCQDFFGVGLIFDGFFCFPALSFREMLVGCSMDVVVSSLSLMIFQCGFSLG